MWMWAAAPSASKGVQYAAIHALYVQGQPPWPASLGYFGSNTTAQITHSGRFASGSSGPEVEDVGRAATVTAAAAACCCQWTMFWRLLAY
jgi:hypothetical protein